MKTKIINLYGKVGTGKSNIIANLNMNKKDAFLIDFKGDRELINMFIYSRGINLLIEDNQNNKIIRLKEIVKLIIKDIVANQFKYIIIDEAEPLFNNINEFKNEELLNLVKYILDFVRVSDVILILVSQEKIETPLCKIEPFEILNFNEVNIVREKIEAYIKG